MRLGTASPIERFLSLILAFAFFLSAVTPQIQARQEPSKLDYRLNQTFMLGFGEDAGEVFTAPGKWKGENWWRFAAVLGTGAVLYACDQKIHDWSQDRRTPASVDGARFGSFLGGGAFLGGLIASLYLSGEIYGDQNLRKTALLSLESWAIAGALVLGLKAIGGRARPYTNLGSRCFRPFSFRAEHVSFPSGHAASAFAVATVIADQTENVLVDVLAYSLSTLAAAARVHENKHWASDSFIGAVIGYVVGKKICSLHRKRSIRTEMCLSRAAAGVSITFCF